MGPPHLPLPREKLDEHQCRSPRRALGRPTRSDAVESGGSLVRYLVTVRSDEPRRHVDVLPVTHWNRGPGLLESPHEPGHRLMIAGNLQQRFWDGQADRRTQLEIVAHSIDLRPEAGEHNPKVTQ